MITHNSDPQLLSTMGTRLNTGSLRDQIYRRIGIKLVDVWKKHIYKYKNFASEATEVVFTYHNVKQIFTQRFFCIISVLFHLWFFLCPMKNEVVINVLCYQETSIDDGIILTFCQ